MDVITLYNIGNYSYFLSDQKVITRNIETITIFVNNNNKIDITYHYYTYPKSVMGINPLINIKEEFVFSTKEELLKSL